MKTLPSKVDLWISCVPSIESQSPFSYCHHGCSSWHRALGHSDAQLLQFQCGVTVQRQENIQSVCFEFGHGGKCPSHSWFISTHDWGLDVIWLFSDSLSGVLVPDLIRSNWRDRNWVTTCKLRFAHVRVGQLAPRVNPARLRLQSRRRSWCVTMLPRQSLNAVWTHWNRMKLF